MNNTVMNNNYEQANVLVVSVTGGSAALGGSRICDRL